jgi:zinc D-Ala-D-Ala carboxypeptidase
VRRQRERVVKSRTSWRKADQVKKIKIVMTMILVALCLSVAAGTVLVWVQVKHPFDQPSSSSASVSAAAPVSSESEMLPVYEDSYNLVLVNTETPLKSDFNVALAKYDGILVDEKIVPALKKMMEDAKASGCALKLTGGYVDSQKQNQLFQAEVQNWMKKQKYTQVRAENQAQNTVGRSGYNENQTGMAVEFSAEGSAANADFATTSQYKWLIKNSVSYGFVLRYPNDKTGITGKSFSPRHFRYVGGDNAVKMREYSMCLEEYAAYIHQQAAG